MQQINKNKGILIVLEGSDGCGKETQTKLLVEQLHAEKHIVKTMDFPQYKTNVAGKLLRECLQGDHGDFLKVPPKIASCVYAMDRVASKDTIEKWLAEGYVVVLDRYVSANILHQTSKIKDVAERYAYIGWVRSLEYGDTKLPQPDLTLYLHVPWGVRKELMRRQGRKGDIAEVDESHQQAVDDAAELCACMDDWKIIDCTQEGTLLSIEEIHDRIWKVVQLCIV